MSRSSRGRTAQTGVTHGRLFLSLTTALSVLVASACGAPAPGTMADRDQNVGPVLNGTPDGTNSLFGTVQVNYPGGYCSGSLLTNSWVLTARHCFPPGAPNITGVNVSIGTGTAFQQMNVPISIMVFHPTTFINPASQGIDVALLKVTAPFSVTSNGNVGAGASTVGYSRNLWPYGSNALTGLSGNCAGVGPNTTAQTGGGVGLVRTGILPVLGVPNIDERDENNVTRGDIVFYRNTNPGNPSAGQIWLRGDSGGACFYNVAGRTVLGTVNAATNPMFTDANGPAMRQDVKNWVDQTLFTPGTSPSWGANTTALGLTVSSRGPNTMDIFWRDFFGSITTIPFDNGYGPMTDLGRPTGISFLGRPAAASWASNRIDVFARGDDNHIWQKTKLNGAWGSWSQRGTQLVSSSPAVASWGPNRLDLFAAGPNKDLLHDAFTNGSWTNLWVSLGGIMNGDPAAVSWGPGRIDVIHRGNTGEIYHKGYENGWQPSVLGWNSLGGNMMMSPTISSWGPGRLDIFVWRFGEGLQHRWFDGDWVSDWIKFDPGNGGVSDPAAVSWGPGKIDIFTRGGSPNPIWQTQYPR